MDLNALQKKWFALHVKTRMEGISSSVLQEKGYDTYLPLMPPRRGGPSGVGWISPLFPGYLFCRVTDHVIGPAVRTPGVISIVRCGGIPVAVEEEQIEAIRRITESGRPFHSHAGARAGQMVRVEYGALKGLRGFFVRAKHNDWLVISVTLLQRSVLVEIDASWISFEHMPAQERSGARPTPLELATARTAT